MAAGRPAREPAQLQGLGGDLRSPPIRMRATRSTTVTSMRASASSTVARASPHRSAPRTAAGPGRPPVPRRRQRQGVRHRADDQQRRMVEPRGSRTATTSASTTPRRRSTARRQAAPTSRRRRRSSRAPTATSTPTPRTSGSAASTITRRCCNRTATTTSPASRTPTSRSVTRSCSPIPRTRARPTWSSRATRRPARCTHLHQRGSRLRAERSVQGRSQRGDEFGRSVSKGQCRLAIATNPQLTEWKFLPPILSANCVDDQTERPQIYLKDGKYYLFTISHRTTMAAGVDGPDGVYGFVGNGIRSDFLPLNGGSGLVLGNPTDFSAPAGAPYSQDPNQNPREFQSYSHYVMPGACRVVHRCNRPAPRRHARADGEGQHQRHVDGGRSRLWTRRPAATATFRRTCPRPAAATAREIRITNNNARW